MNRNFMKMVSVLVILAFSFAALGVEPAQASLKHFLIGGAAGAGIVLAWPTITAAVGAAAGAIGSVAAGIGGAIATGVGAVSGAVAVGGAAVGGAVAGAGAAAGAAVTGVFGAIGGAIAAITASPLFVPALLIAGAVLIGYLIYKKKKGSGLFTKKLSPSLTTNNTSAPVATSTAYAPAISTSAAASAATKTTTAPAINTTASTSSNLPSNFRASAAASVPSTISASTAERKPNTAATQATTAGGDNAVKTAHDKYVAAYKKYINLLSGKKSTDPEVQAALQEYKSAFDDYQKLLKN